MGMKPYSYVVAGIKTTREECTANSIDIYEQFDDNEEVSVVYGEGTDDVLIGKILFETDPYDDTDNAIELTIPDTGAMLGHLAASGVNTIINKIGLYAITVWL